MNIFITDKYLRQNILIFNQLGLFGKLKGKFRRIFFERQRNLKMN